MHNTLFFQFNHASIYQKPHQTYDLINHHLHQAQIQIFSNEGHLFQPNTTENEWIYVHALKSTFFVYCSLI